ncbi:MAG: Nitroreductase family protein [Candidatus Omnitrophica bacterium ADurb.Bin292]|nr:MAG: Nitroreductase family protein [Candidatus Omnitrophica bacterium ADurb.Bin292]
MKRLFLIILMLSLFTTIFQDPGFTAEVTNMRLLPPDTEGGKPLMQALSERKSSREFRPDELPPQVLSNLLWAANGVNRPDGRRTSPSAKNTQEIEIYVAKKEALYLYDAKEHALTVVIPEDIRSRIGRQVFVQDAPVGLIFVSNTGKFRGGSEEDALFYSATDTGYVGQNVYLFCASEGLSTVVLGTIDRDQLAKTMKLQPRQRIILTQPVGYPKNRS